MPSVVIQAKTTHLFQQCRQTTLCALCCFLVQAPDLDLGHCRPLSDRHVQLAVIALAIACPRRCCQIHLVPE